MVRPWIPSLEGNYEAGSFIIPLLQPWASDVGFGSYIQVAQLPLSLKDSNWHHICIAWTTRDGLWSAYQDGELRGSGENLAAWHAIKPHGILILGQEQDTLGGRFDATQAFVGDIAQFNLWDHALTPAQVQGMANCTGPLMGNVLPWEDKLVEAFGGAKKAAFDVCKGRAKA